MKRLFMLLLLLVACGERVPEPVVTVDSSVVQSDVASVPVEQVVTDVASAHQVDIVNFAYQPASLEVSVGDTVTWTQRDDVKHTVTVVNGPDSFDSGLLAKGQSFSFTFTKPGVYEYSCTPHPRMRGVIVVK